MNFNRLSVFGAALIDLDTYGDDRGFFARAWCTQEFGAQGLSSRIVQVNDSYNAQRGTLRGMHYQKQPYEEAKTVRCVRGSIFDVVVDIRPHSPTKGRWYGTELTAENRQMLLVPEGCAHGFITLEDDTEVLYMVSEFYTPQAEGGFRWDDPAFEIDWPLTPSVISEKDSSWPDFDLTMLNTVARRIPA